VKPAEIRAEVLAGRVLNPESICSRCKCHPITRHNVSRLCNRCAQFMASSTA